MLDFRVFCRGHKEFVEIVPHLKLEFYLGASPLGHALEMAAFATLHTPPHLGLRAAPHFQAPALTVAHIVALVALEDTFRSAFACLVTHCVALEAQFLVAFERVMAVLPAEDAIQARRFEVIRTLSGEMAEFLTIPTLHSWVVEVLQKIARRLLFKFREEVFVFFNIFWTLRFRFGGLVIRAKGLCDDSLRDVRLRVDTLICNTRINTPCSTCLLLLLILQAEMAAEVSVALQRATRCQQIRITA